MPIVELTKENFDQVTEHYEIILMDFWATWCVPCLSFAKVYEEIAEQYPEICFAKINIEKQTELAQLFEIYSVPTLLIMRDEIVVFAEVGSITKKTLLDLIKQTTSLDMKKMRKQLCSDQSE